jgi:hypothetical protein
MRLCSYCKRRTINILRMTHYKSYSYEFLLLPYVSIYMQHNFCGSKYCGRENRHSSSGAYDELASRNLGDVLLLSPARLLVRACIDARDWVLPFQNRPSQNLAELILFPRKSAHKGTCSAPMDGLMLNNARTWYWCRRWSSRSWLTCAHRILTAWTTDGISQMRPLTMTIAAVIYRVLFADLRIDLLHRTDLRWQETSMVVDWLICTNPLRSTNI